MRHVTLVFVLFLITTTCNYTPIFGMEAPKKDSWWDAKQIMEKQLQTAVNNNDLDEVKKLFNEGACPYSVIVTQYQDSPIFKLIKAQKDLNGAAKFNDVTWIQQCFDDGANPNATDEDGWTPLHTAVMYGRKIIITPLINRGANINAKDCKDRTPLHWGVINNWPEIVEELLKYKTIDIDARDIYGFTPLHFAANHNNVCVVLCLISHGANVLAVTKTGETAAQLARNKGYARLAKWLEAQAQTEGKIEIATDWPGF